jgi:hypothetical protein
MSPPRTVLRYPCQKGGTSIQENVCASQRRASDFVKTRPLIEMTMWATQGQANGREADINTEQGLDSLQAH